MFIVFANADPSAGYRGITAFIIERDFKGFKVGKKEDKLGIRASSTIELLLDNCEVPEENVLGPVGQGYKIAIETLNEGRIGIGAQMIAGERAQRHLTATSQRAQAIRQGPRRPPGHPVPGCAGRDAELEGSGAVAGLQRRA